MTALTDRHREVLDSLSGVHDGQFLAPLDFGGRDSSHHSATARALAKRGLVEAKKSHSMSCYHGSTQRQELVDGRWVYSDGHPPSVKCCCKGSIRYRITNAGRTELAAALLGPANDRPRDIATAIAIAIEIHAARLAAVETELLDHYESLGWESYDDPTIDLTHDAASDEHQHAGYLARFIVEHRLADARRCPNLIEW